MSKAQASMVKTIDLIELDSHAAVHYVENDDQVIYYGEVHALDAIGIAIYTVNGGTQFFPWTAITKVVVY